MCRRTCKLPCDATVAPSPIPGADRNAPMTHILRQVDLNITLDSNRNRLLLLELMALTGSMGLSLLNLVRAIGVVWRGVSLRTTPPPQRPLQRSRPQVLAEFGQNLDSGLQTSWSGYLEVSIITTALCFALVAAVAVYVRWLMR